MNPKWRPRRAMLLLAAVVLLAGACRDFNTIIREYPVPPPANPVELVQELAQAYRTQSFAKFEGILADDYVFVLDHPTPGTGATHWDAATERRIHSRMFDPENIQPSDPQLPPAHWLQTVSITLSPQMEFVERVDLYTTFDPPGPLDPARWIAHGAISDTDVFFQLQGEADYQITGRAYFVVIEDRTKQVGEIGKFLLFQWEDLGRNPSAETEEKSWTSVKTLYN